MTFFPCIGLKFSFVVERMLCILDSQFLETSILSIALVTRVLHILKLVTVDAFKQEVGKVKDECLGIA